MKARIWISAALAACISGIGAVAFAASGADPSSPPSAADQTNVNARAREALPDSRANLATARHSGLRLTISVDAADAKTPPGSDDPLFAAPTSGANAGIVPLAELGWKAHLVSGVASARDSRITEFAVDWPGIDNAQADLMTYRVRGEPGTDLYQFPRLGKVGVAEAQKQLRSNLQALESALPAGVMEGSRVVVVPVDAANGLFGLDAQIRVSDLTALRAHLGDLVDGLATGLVGDGTAVVEGLAVNVVDDQGDRAGWWRSERTATGFGIPGPDLAGATVGATDVDFANLTGGPDTTRSVSGGTAAASPPPMVLKPDRAIGPFRLGMKRSDVEKRLGRGKPPGGAIVEYKTGHGKLTVAYSKTDRVDEIRAKSINLTAYGTPLKHKSASLKRLKAHGWKVKHCAPYVVAQHFGKSRASGVIWRGKHLLQAGVSARGGIDVCPVGSPAA